ncbi:universal stress protein [Marmoricola sp. RAF53]|uniref:universal stress protein n=1 Tax=Marmoricola sp. RAF53 TaxID=3233059 RepID=UPI003F9BEA21
MNIVVGYVPTPEGVAAFEYATAAAQRDDATLVVVNTGYRGDDSGPSFASQTDLDAIADQLAALGVAHEIRQPANADSPADEVLKAAEETDADLIVIGLRRRSAVGKLFLGSSAQQILLESVCPVVAVKQR